MSPPAVKKDEAENGADNTGNEAREVTLFREYLRIKSVHPNPDYDGTNAFLKRMAGELGLPCRIVEMVEGKPIFLMEWKGTDPSLPALLLNSHTDVVPVFEEFWKCDPFAAIKDEKGNIYARGTQDMKCVSIQHLEAIRRLKEKGMQFKRTIHLCFIADEEVGGHDGMQKFVVSEEFKKMNVGMALDEGLASPDDTVPVYYGERNAFMVYFVCKGNTGHGSRFIQDTAAEKVQYLMNKLLDFREKQKKIFDADSSLTLGDVSTVNLTMMSGGVQINVVPDEFKVGFDIRITPTTNIKEFEDMIMKWIEEADGNIDVQFAQKFTDQTMTSVADDDPWFKAFMKGVDKHSLKVAPRIFPAGTDSRFLREVGIPALGFSPMNNTPVLLHDHNEFLNEKIFLKGIDIFEDIITEMASV